jgi:hypothetical protein
MAGASSGECREVDTTSYTRGCRPGPSE